MLLLASSSALLEVQPLKMELVVGVVELGALSSAPEGQGVEVEGGSLCQRQGPKDRRWMTEQALLQ